MLKKNHSYLVTIILCLFLSHCSSGIDATTFTSTTSEDFGESDPVNITALASTVTEGSSTTLTISLSAAPTDDVIITPSLSGASSSIISDFAALNISNDQLTVSPASLTFTSQNYNQEQSFTVNGLDDDLDDETQTVTLGFGISSTDARYAALTLDSLQITIEDNDTSGITVSALSGNTSEAGTTATFTVVLDAKPTANVLLTLSSSDETEGTLSPSTLTFTAENWSTPQTVTVTGANDLTIDGDITYNVQFSSASSNDENYNGTEISNISVVNQDPDCTKSLNTSATPAFENIVVYEDFNGGSDGVAIGDGAEIAADIGSYTYLYYDGGDDTLTFIADGDGFFNSSIIMDGDDDLIGSVSSDFNITGSMTTAVWVYMPSQSGEDFYHIVGAIGDSQSLPYYVWVDDDLDLYYGFYSDSSGDSLAVTSSESVPASEWTHIVYVRDDSAKTVTLYVNGQISSEGAVDYTGNSPTNTDSTMIHMVGGLAVGLGVVYPTLGVFDEAVLWNVPLSASQVQTVYDQQLNCVVN